MFKTPCFFTGILLNFMFSQTLFSFKENQIRSSIPQGSEYNSISPQFLTELVDLMYSLSLNVELECFIKEMCMQ